MAWGCGIELQVIIAPVVAKVGQKEFYGSQNLLNLNVPYLRCCNLQEK